MWRQLVEPDTDTVGIAGWCLMFVTDVYGAPRGVPTAQDAWDRNPDKHTDEIPPVSVPLYFSGFGGMGHIVALIPGIGILSSPPNGTGQAWYDTIEQVERAFNVSYLGWTPSLNGLYLVEYVPDPPKRKTKKMGAFFRNSKTGEIVYQASPGVKVIGVKGYEWQGYAAQGNKYADLAPDVFAKLPR